MSGNHKRKKRDMHVEWMSKACITLIRLMQLLEIKSATGGHSWQKLWACDKLSRKHYENKRINQRI